MANLRAEFKRASLRTIFNALNANTAQDLFMADSPPSNLNEALQAFQNFMFPKVMAGSTLAGTAGAGHSTTNALPSIWRTLNPEEQFALSEELLTIYGDALTTLAASTPPIVNPDDPTIFNTMMLDDRMQSVTSTQRDFTVARLPWTRLG